MGDKLISAEVLKSLLRDDLEIDGASFARVVRYINDMPDMSNRCNCEAKTKEGNYGVQD